MKKDRSIFECHPLEKSRVIFQLGSADPDLAVQAAKMVQNDVAGIGLNCGCPKPFSISGGMGAALMHVPDKLCAVSQTCCLAQVGAYKLDPNADATQP